jgi:hypothetical protein
MKIARRDGRVLSHALSKFPKTVGRSHGTGTPESLRGSRQAHVSFFLCERQQFAIWRTGAHSHWTRIGHRGITGDNSEAARELESLNNEKESGPEYDPEVGYPEGIENPINMSRRVRRLGRARRLIFDSVGQIHISPPLLHPEEEQRVCQRTLRCLEDYLVNFG